MVQFAFRRKLFLNKSAKVFKFVETWKTHGAQIRSVYLGVAAELTKVHVDRSTVEECCEPFGQSHREAGILTM